MKNYIIMVLFGVFLSGCVAHAHSPVHHKHGDNVVQRPITIKTWVWSPGYYRANGVWIRGHWYVTHVPRYMINRHPHTHIRWIEGRRRPSPPMRSYRYHRGNHRANHHRKHRHRPRHQRPRR